MTGETARNAVETAESIPLLGRTRTEAIEQIDTVLADLDPDRFPALCLRLIARRFLAHSVTPESLEQLSIAEQWASAEQADSERVRLQLLWCAFVGRRFPEAIPTPILDQAVETAKTRGQFAVEWRLARASIDPDRASALRREAVALMPTPADDALRITTLLDLADDLTRGSDEQGAIRAIDEAVAIAQAHDDTDRMCQTLLRKALTLLNSGRTRAATEPLSESFALACQNQDDLTAIIAGIPLSAIHVAGGNLAEARRIANRMLVSGARRANWFAVVDGHVTLSSIHRMEGDDIQAIAQLVRAVIRLRELVPGAALNILKGRLAELRNEIGPHAFDAHYRAATTDHSETN